MTLGVMSNSKPKSVNMSEVVQKARDAYNQGVTRSVEWRRKQLKSLLRMYKENENAMVEALNKDLRRCKTEAILLEVQYLINDLENTLDNLDEWMKPERPSKGLVNVLDEVVIYNDPYGVVLVIGAWNYPLQLLLLPMSGAIAAGNAVIVKPSEVAVACAKFVAETLPKYLDNDAIIVVEGGPEETSELLNNKFDYIFYTGSTSVGKIIYAAATKHLTPVTLELGGKSPAFIDNTVDIAVTAKRVLWGKLINAGQTCIAPDYVLCTKEVQDKFVEAAKKVLIEWYGEKPQKSEDLCRIINSRHFSRLTSLLEDGKSKVVIGGEYDSQDLFIAPTVLANVTENDKIMQDEIFGPILPIVPVENAYEAIKFINARDHPLVIYAFSKQNNILKLFTEQTRSGSVCYNDTVMFYAGCDDKRWEPARTAISLSGQLKLSNNIAPRGIKLLPIIECDLMGYYRTGQCNKDKPLVIYVFSTNKDVSSSIVNNTSSGGMCINDTMMQMAVDTLPFGGVGNSGVGAYHGKATFNTFTHKKSCLARNFSPIGEKLGSARYPPYTEGKLNMIKGLTKKRNLPSFKFISYILTFALGAGISYGFFAWHKVKK